MSQRLIEDIQEETNAGDSHDGTASEHFSGRRFRRKETVWLIYSLELAVLEKNVRPALKSLNVLREACERTASLRGSS